MSARKLKHKSDDSSFGSGITTVTHGSSDAEGKENGERLHWKRLSLSIAG